jgi:hypothetical protein
VIDENSGIVIPCSFDSDQRGAPVLFFVNEEAPADRRRHTLVHELGHMVLHTTALKLDGEMELRRTSCRRLHASGRGAANPAPPLRPPPPREHEELLKGLHAGDREAGRHAAARNAVPEQEMETAVQKSTTVGA